ncbi:P9-1 [Diaphorina citri reovirus]|nr:P9-1 [Diaphorina citri reovirus]
MNVDEAVTFTARSIKQQIQRKNNTNDEIKTTEVIIANERIFEFFAKNIINKLPSNLEYYEKLFTGCRESLVIEYFEDFEGEKLKEKGFDVLNDLINNKCEKYEFALTLNAHVSFKFPDHRFMINSNFTVDISMYLELINHLFTSFLKKHMNCNIVPKESSLQFHQLRFLAISHLVLSAVEKKEINSKMLIFASDYNASMVVLRLTALTHLSIQPSILESYKANTAITIDRNNSNNVFITGFDGRTFFSRNSKSVKINNLQNKFNFSFIN